MRLKTVLSALKNVYNFVLNIKTWHNIKMTADQLVPLSLMLKCGACQIDYKLANIGFDKPNDFITCPHCSKTSFLHKSVGSEQEKYFEILGSDFCFQTAKETLAEADLAAESDKNISEENLRLWINDTLSKTPEKDLPEPETAYNRKSSALSNLLDNMFTTLRVTYLDGRQETFESLSKLEEAILDERITQNDTLDYKNERATLAKHSKTRTLFMDNAQKEMLQNLKNSKTELFTGAGNIGKSKTGLSLITEINGTALLLRILSVLGVLAISLVIAFFAYKKL